MPNEAIDSLPTLPTVATVTTAVEPDDDPLSRYLFGTPAKANFDLSMSSPKYDALLGFELSHQLIPLTLGPQSSASQPEHPRAPAAQCQRTCLCR